MNWISWLVPALILLPLAGGLLAGVIINDRLRNVLVSLLALPVAAGGIAVVCLSTFFPGGIWTMTVPSWAAYAGNALEVAIIAVLLIVSLKIRNAWIFLLTLLQLAGVAAGVFVPADHTSTFTLFKIDNLARIMLLVSCCVGAAILLFSVGYMKRHKEHAPQGAGSLQRFYFFFLSFLGLMIGLVVTNHLSFFSFFWEGTTLCSYALIGQDGGEA